MTKTLKPLPRDAVVTQRSAADLGAADAETWLRENHCSVWPDAIRPGQLPADEGLINALGAAGAARYIGVHQAYVDGVLTDEATAAFRAYSEAWAERVREAIAEAQAD